jgi:hypothetical protein
MNLDVNNFIKACNPTRMLILSDAVQRRYYIDFAKARSRQPSKKGLSLIGELFRTITLNDDPTYQLFTGHIGCGKSTELRKLQDDLEHQGFHVVYLDSSEDLVMTDVDISDILLTVARQISKSLTAAKIKLNPTGFQGLLQKTWSVLQSDVSVSGEVNTPVGKFGGSTTGEVSADLLGIGKFSAKFKGNPDARARLRQYLEPQTDNILELINKELLEPANKALQERGQKGIVAIVDSLDRLENTKERNQAEYIFVTRFTPLRRIKCHMVYTIPLVLNFSNSIATLSDRFGGAPKVLPMVRVKNRDNQLHEEGIHLLRDMVLARAFPDLPSEERAQYLDQVFENQETCDRLCTVSGGHVRNLLVLLYGCLQKQDPPIDRDTLEEVIATQRDSLVRAITASEWELLKQVRDTKTVAGEEGCQTLLRSLFVFEYLDELGTWSGLNPILAEAEQLK